MRNLIKQSLSVAVNTDNSGTKGTLHTQQKGCD